MHLDYGLKGNHLDVNPDDGMSDRYDHADTASAWGSRDALMDTVPGGGPLAIADCTDYEFRHYIGATHQLTDVVQNLNVFKKEAGAVGLLTAGDQSLTGVTMKLVRNSTGATVATAVTDDGGYYALNYKHRGRHADFTISGTVSDEGRYPVQIQQQVNLKGNGMVDASYDASTDTWTVIYGQKQ